MRWEPASLLSKNIEQPIDFEQKEEHKPMSLPAGMSLGSYEKKEYDMFGDKAQLQSN